MNKKNLFKFLLDICMAIVFALMYSKMAISLTFHEIGGLVLLSTFLFHILINWKWVVVVTKKIFSKDLPLKTKLGYIINILLLISFVLIGLSGIMISKIVFHISNTASLPWKTIHYFCSAFALILVGIHLGLHKQFISNMLNKLIPVTRKIGNAIGITLTLAIFIYGCYSLTTTSFVSWLVMPFSQQANSFGGPGGERMPSDFPSEGQPTMNGSGSPSDDNLAADGSGSPSDDKLAADSSGSPSEGKPAADDSGFRGNKHDGAAYGGNIGANEGSSILRALNTFASFFSITFVFAVVTFLIECLTIYRKKNKRIQIPAQNIVN